MEDGEEAEGGCVESTADLRKRRMMCVEKPRLKIQTLFRAAGGRSRRARNDSFARENMCLLRRRLRLSPCWDNNNSLSSTCRLSPPHLLLL